MAVTMGSGGRPMAPWPMAVATTVAAVTAAAVGAAVAATTTASGTGVNAKHNENAEIIMIRPV